MKKFLSFMVSLLVTITAFAGTKSVAEDVTPKSIKIGSDSFVQVTSAPDDWSGEYIIVANVGGKDLIWNGLDAGQNGIAAADTVAVVTVAKGTNDYSILVNNGKNAGKYVGINSYKNGLYFNATATELKFEFDSIAVKISNKFDDGSVYLLYNKTSGSSNERFRFYKDTNLGKDSYIIPVLYKKAAAAPTTATVTVDASDRVKIVNTDTYASTVLVAGANAIDAGSYGILVSDPTYVISEVKKNGVVVEEQWGNYMVDLAVGDSVTVTTAAKEVKQEVEPEPETPVQVLAEGDYLIVNVEGGYLGGNNNWGTQASNINKPQWFTVTLKDGKYLLDSHQSNGGDSHYLGNGLYVDAAAYGWTIQALDANNATFSIKADSLYLAAKQGIGNPVELLAQDSLGTTSNYIWKFVPLTELVASMDNATDEHPVDVTALIKDPELKRNANTSGYWTITGFNGEGTPSNFAQGQGGNHAACGESYHSTNGFKAVQSIVLPKAGVYELSAQGFYRNDGEDTLLPYIFADDAKSNLPERTGTENSMVEAYASFLAGTYPVEPIRITTTQDNDTIAIGVAGESTSKWNIFGEFDLKYYGAPTLSLAISPAEGTVESIEQIVIESNEKITISSTAKVTLLGNMNNIVELDSAALADALSNNSMITINLMAPVTAAGNYILNIAAGSFVGTESGLANIAKTVNYSINEKPREAVDAEIKSTQNITEKQVEITMNIFVAPLTTFEGVAVIYNENGDSVTTAKGNFGLDFWDAKSVMLEFTSDLAAGTYTAKVPEGMFENPDEEGQNPTPVKAFTVTFTVEAPAPVIALAEGYTAITSADELEGWEVVLMNVDNGEYVYGSNNQNIGTSADFAVASASTNSAPSFRIVKDALGFKFVALTPAGENYNIWGACPSYINSQPNDGGVSFILNDKNPDQGYVGGQDLNNGAIWTCEYDTEKAAFTIKNVGSGLYLNGSTVTSTPVYYAIARKSDATNAIATISATSAKAGKYMENGKLVIVKNGVKYNTAGQTIK